MTLSRFIGRNVARLKFAHAYTVIFAYLITAISTFVLAVNLSFIYVFIFLPIALIFVWFAGYIIDKKGIYKADYSRTQLQHIEGIKSVHSILWRDVIIPQMKEMFKEILEDFREELKESDFK